MVNCYFDGKEIRDGDIMTTLDSTFYILIHVSIHDGKLYKQDLTTNGEKEIIGEKVTKLNDDKLTKFNNFRLLMRKEEWEKLHAKMIEKIGHLTTEAVEKINQEIVDFWVLDKELTESDIEGHS